MEVNTELEFLGVILGASAIMVSLAVILVGTAVISRFGRKED